MGLVVSIVLNFKFYVDNVHDGLEAKASEVFGVVLFQESR